jgi:hypothetical protein
VRGPRQPRWSKVAGRRSISWSTRDWIMEEVDVEMCLGHYGRGPRKRVSLRAICRATN